MNLMAKIVAITIAIPAAAPQTTSSAFGMRLLAGEGARVFVKTIVTWWVLKWVVYQT